MVDNGDRIIIALSGGPDSITLLHILHTLRNKLNINYLCNSCKSSFKREDAYKDEENCKKYCEKLGIPLFY